MPGSTGAPYNLPYPLGTEQPFAHLDMKALAEAIVTAIAGVAPGRSRFRVYRAAALSFPADGEQAIGWDTEALDTGGNFTPTTNGGFWTAPRTGLVRFTTRVSATASPTVGGRSYAQIKESTDGGATWPTEVLRGTDTSASVSTTAPLSSFVDGLVSVTAGRAYSSRPFFTAPGSTKPVDVGAALCWFTGEYDD